MYVSELLEILEECDPDAEVVLVTKFDESNGASAAWTEMYELRRVEVRAGVRAELTDDEFNELADHVADAWGVDAIEIIEERRRRAECGVTSGLLVGAQRAPIDADLVIVRGW